MSVPHGRYSQQSISDKVRSTVLVNVELYISCFSRLKGRERGREQGKDREQDKEQGRDCREGIAGKGFRKKMREVEEWNKRMITK